MIRGRIQPERRNLLANFLHVPRKKISDLFHRRPERDPTLQVDEVNVRPRLSGVLALEIGHDQTFCDSVTAQLLLVIT
jgi:hypothetical protein